VGLIRNIADRVIGVHMAIKDRAMGKPESGKRSDKWPTVRRHYLAEHPACAWCGSTKNKRQVHHQRPFFDFPALELDHTNLLTLCEHPGKCEAHLHVGHDNSFKTYNPNVASDCLNHHEPDLSQALPNCSGK
jgi:hypothetical protein